MNALFPTYEVGSLAKPPWRVKGYAGIRLTGEDLAYAEKWAKALGLDYGELERVLKGDAPDRRQRIVELSALIALKMFESAGLDYVYDGEQWRVEMYEHVVRSLGGFRFQGWVKSFDYRYYKKASAVDKVAYREPFYVDEYLSVRQQTGKPLKVPITGPYTLTDWTFNEYYERRRGDVKSFKERRHGARRDLIFDLVDEALRPEFRRLVDAGVEWIQIDEPAVTTKEDPEEMELFVEAYNRLTAGFDVRFSLHNCFSNYDVLARYVPELKRCSQLSLEYANRDSREPGRHRTGYDGLDAFLDGGYAGGFAPGFIDVHTDFVESPELVRDRILYVAERVGEERLWVSPDCGLRTRSWEVAYEKLCNIVKGAELARELVKPCY